MIIVMPMKRCTGEWNGKKWNVISEFTLNEDGHCRPDDVEIDFESMTIAIL